MPPQHRKAQLGWSHGDLGFNVGQVAPTSLETLSRNRRDLSWRRPRTIPEDRPNSCSGSPRLTTAYKTNVSLLEIRDAVYDRPPRNFPSDLEIGSAPRHLRGPSNYTTSLCLRCSFVNWRGLSRVVAEQDFNATKWSSRVAYRSFSDIVNVRRSSRIWLIFGSRFS